MFNAIIMDILDINYAVDNKELNGFEDAKTFVGLDSRESVVHFSLCFNGDLAILEIDGGIISGAKNIRRYLKG
jgi:hypothetical protein